MSGKSVDIYSLNKYLLSIYSLSNTVVIKRTDRIPELMKFSSYNGRYNKQVIKSMKKMIANAHMALKIKKDGTTECN